MALTGRLNIGSDPEREAKARAIDQMAPLATQQWLQAEQARAELNLENQERSAMFWHQVRTSVAVIVLTGMILGTGIALVGASGWALWMVKQARMPAIKQAGAGIVLVGKDSPILIDEYTGARGLLTDKAGESEIRARVVIEKGKQDVQRDYLQRTKPQNRLSEKGTGSDSVVPVQVWDITEKDHHTSVQ
jgi:aconitase B